VDANLLPTGKEAKGGSPPCTRLVWVGLITHLDEISYPEEPNRENRTDLETRRLTAKGNEEEEEEYNFLNGILHRSRAFSQEPSICEGNLRLLICIALLVPFCKVVFKTAVRV
jgi:hypothetical protein